MIVHRDIDQGSPEWVKIRLGVVTGSGIDGVLTPGKLLPSKATGYLNQLVAETLLGQPCDEFDGSAWTERGTQMEDEARRWYEFDRDVTVERVGFISTDDGRVGCSPDGLVGDDGGVEIKCPSAKTFVGYAADPTTLAAAYLGQTQVFLYVTGRKWIDLVAYNPAFNPVVVRVVADPAYQAALASVLPVFVARIDAAVAKLRDAVNLCPL